MDGGPGRLPRTTFVDDPFFNHDPFDGFSRDTFTRSPQPQRRFGSTPRLIDDDFFRDDFDRDLPHAFGSLPRHRHTSRSPRPPTDRGTPPTQPGTQERSIPVQRASPNSSPSQQQPQQQSSSPKKSPVPKAAVEINNAASSYTNGELNPDRRQQSRAPDSPNNVEGKIPVEIVQNQRSSPPPKKVASARGSQEVLSDVISETPIPLPPPPAEPKPPVTNGETRRVAFKDKKISLDGIGSEKLIHLLDEAERRVNLLREMAAQLEQEKEQLLDTLGTVKLNADFLRLDQHDRDDIDNTADRLLTRCKAVEVSVFTPRNENQAKALEEVNKLIEIVTLRMKEDISSAKGTVERYFNACCPDDEPGPVDSKFQSRVIECTADDQKKIRRKLAQIIEQIERAERVCNHPDY